MTTGTYEAGDVVSAYIPYVDAQGGKLRPAVVVSSEAYNRRTNQIVVVPVTSSPAPRGRTVSATLAEGELPLESNIKTDILITLEDKLIKRRLGRLTDAARDEVAVGVVTTLYIPQR